MTILDSAPQSTPAVHKFGGSSVATSARIQNVADIITSHTMPNDIIVVSANGKMTDWLEALHQGQSEVLQTISDYYEQLATDTLKNPQALLTFFRGTLKQLKAAQHNNKELSADEVLAFGEVWSANLLAEHLNERGTPARFIDARTLFSTSAIDDFNAFDLNYFDAGFRKCQKQTPARRAIITGFIANNQHGKTTTLGRNGSDYTASLLARFSKASSVTLWTDVAGIYSADPRLIQQAHPIERLDYAEAAALAAVGTNVLHQKTIGPLMNLPLSNKEQAGPRKVAQNIPLFIRSSLKPEQRGTQVNTRPFEQHECSAKSVAVKTKLIKVNLQTTDQNLIDSIQRHMHEQHIPSVYAKQLANLGEISLLIPSEHTQQAISYLDSRECLFSTESTTHAMIGIIGQNITHNSSIIQNIENELPDNATYTLAEQNHPNSLLLLTPESEVFALLQATYRACFPKSVTSQTESKNQHLHQQNQINHLKSSNQLRLA